MRLTAASACKRRAPDDNCRRRNVDGRQDKPLPRRLCAMAARPAGLLGRGRGRDRLDREAEDRVRSATPASMAAGSPTASATPATTRWTATSRPAAASRRRSSTTRRSPAPSRPSPTRRCRPRPRSSPASSSTTSASRRATASSSTCRWCRRRWSAMLACARIGAIHSVVFGGFAPKELATRIDDCTPKVMISASCGIEGARVIPYKPLLDEAIRLVEAQAVRLPDPATAAGEGRTDARAAITTGRRPGTTRWSGRTTCSSRCR